MRRPDASQSIHCFIGIDAAMYGYLRLSNDQQTTSWPGELTHPSAIEAAERAGVVNFPSYHFVLICSHAEHAARKAEAREKKAERTQDVVKNRQDFPPVSKSAFSPWLTPGSRHTSRVGRLAATGTYSANVNAFPTYNSFTALASSSPTIFNSGSLFDGDSPGTSGD